MVAPGTQQATISGLTNGTRYDFSIYAMRSNGRSGTPVAVSATPLLPDFADDAWGGGTSVRRIRLLVDNRDSAESHVNFPLMVRLDSSRIDYSQTDGSDLRFFTEGNTTELFYEIERWDETGESIVWVRINELPALTRSYLWLYWGGDASAFQDAAQVWSEYELVLHMADSTNDSSSHGRHGAAADSDGGPAAVAYEDGAIGQAVRIGDSPVATWVEVDDYVSSFNGVGLSEYTVEVWMRGDAAPGFAAPAGPLMAQRAFNIGWDHTNGSYLESFHFNHSTAGWNALVPGSLASSTWYYAAATFDSTAGIATSYLDGTAGRALSGLTGPMSGELSYLRVGTDGSNANVFDGLVDEVRISHTAKSAAWIAAQHRSMTDTMILFGPAETP